MRSEATHKEPAINRRATYAATLILLLSALLRLGAFHEALVGADQSSILAAAAEIAGLRDAPLVGIKSSVGVMQTAVTAYLAAIPLVVLRRVIAVKWFFTALDLLALAYLYRAVSRVFGRRAALITALLYAANPWLVEFNRWIWYQSLIPTFATVAFSGLLLGMVQGARAIDGGRRARGSQALPGVQDSVAGAHLGLGLVGATLMGLVHLAPLPWAALLCAVGLAVAWRWRLWRGYLIGLASGLVVATPYLVFLVRSGFADVRTILLGGDGAATWNWATYRLTLELLSGREVLRTPRDPLWAASVWAPDALYALFPALLVVGLVLVIWRLATTQRAHRVPLAFTLAWALLAPTLFLRSGIHLQHFYLLFVFPAPLVLVSAGLLGPHRSAPEGRRPFARAVAAIGAASAIVLATWWSHLWIVRIGLEQQGKLRAPTRAWLMDATVDTLDAYLTEHPGDEVVILTNFDGGELSPFDWMRNFLHTDHVRVVSTETGLIVPAGESCYLLGPGASPDDLGDLPSWVAPQLVERPQMAIPASPPWTFRCVDQRPPVPPVQARWQNGLSLIDTQIEGVFAPGERLNIVHTWHYRAVTSEEYHLFNHLMRGQDFVAQIDGAGVPTRYWRDDDVLITEFGLQLPDELPTGEPAYRLLTGAYTWPGIDRVFLEDGRPAYEVRRWTR
ncbi:MAG: hypothetical protein ACP5JG_02360 [Anaerolineae bacterium]